MSHVPVMLNEVMAALDLREGGHIVDGTFGAGGYSRAILDHAGVSVLALDRDPMVQMEAGAMRTAFARRFDFVLTPFSALDGAAQAQGWQSVDGVVLDLGVSSMQIDQAARGFSFMHDGPLDMRMGADGPSAADAVNHLDAGALVAIFRNYGEERHARRAANAIIRAREAAPIVTTGELAGLLAGVLGRGRQKIHPATRVFQALRIYINDELGELGRALLAAEKALAPAGRLVVVAFHSLEDRLVKQFLRHRSEVPPHGSRHVPTGAALPFEPSFCLPVRKVQKPSAAERAANPRARSARLRVGQRTKAPVFSGGEIETPVFAGIPPLSALEALT